MNFQYIYTMAADRQRLKRCDKGCGIIMFSREFLFLYLREDFERRKY